MPARKPPRLKIVAGTSRPDRDLVIVDLPLVDHVPEPPEWLLNSHAIAEWNRLAPILVINRLLTEAGLSALGMLCALHGTIVNLYVDGETPTGAMIAQYRCSCNDFGLTPAYQGKVKQCEKPADGNKFANNAKRA